VTDGRNWIGKSEERAQIERLRRIANLGREKSERRIGSNVSVAVESETQGGRIRLRDENEKGESLD
jgi:hypothetical protein